MVEKSFSEVSPDDYDAVVVPGGVVGADVVRGRRLTSFWTLQTDISNAGGEWVDEEVVTNAKLVTSRYPGDLEVFCTKTVEEFAEGKHPKQARSA